MEASETLTQLPLDFSVTMMNIKIKNELNNNTSMFVSQNNPQSSSAFKVVTPRGKTDGELEIALMDFSANKIAENRDLRYLWIMAFEKYQICELNSFHCWDILQWNSELKENCNKMIFGKNRVDLKFFKEITENSLWKFSSQLDFFKTLFENKLHFHSEFDCKISQHNIL